MSDNTERTYATHAEANELKELIKSKLNGISFNKLTKLLYEKYGVDEAINNLCNKLSRGSLKYIEVKRILDVLGYDIDIVKRT